MSLPTVYPAQINESTGPVDILPNYPPVETVVLRNHVAVLTTEYIDTYDEIQLNADVWTKVASLSIAAQPVDCSVVVRSVSCISVDAVSPVEMFARINTYDTVVIGTYIPASATTGGGAAQVSLQGRSESIASGVAITVDLYIKVSAVSDSHTVSTSLSATVSPSILLA